MNAFFRYRYKSSLFFSFLFSFCVLCVEMLVNFLDACEKRNKNFKKSKHQNRREKERDKRHRLTNVSKTPSSSINSVVLPINNNTLYKR